MVGSTTATTIAVVQMNFVPLAHDIVDGFSAVQADMYAILRCNACASGTGTANDTVTGVGILSLHNNLFLSL